MSTFADAFREAEQRAMSFLVSEHGFRAVGREVKETGSQFDAGRATYVEALPRNASRSEGRFVELSIAPLRLELDLDLGIGEDRRERYTIYELHRFECGGAFPPRQHDLYEAMHNVEQLSDEFMRLGDVLRRCGCRFFSGDRTLWDDLRNQRLSDAQTAGDIRAFSDAARAFKTAQWEKVVALLKPRERRLGKLEAMRLSYAKKRLGWPPNKDRIVN